MGPSSRNVSAETTHELYELMGIKKILEGFRGGTYYTALNKYVDDRVIQLLGMSPPVTAES
jgi:hypothetical protein